MDSIIQKQIDELIVELKKAGQNMNDPVSKLMVTTLIYQTQKIRDEIESIPSRVVDRLCSYFIPGNKVDAIPALCLVQIALKQKKDIVPHSLANGTYFTYKLSAKQILSYYPLFANLIVPYTRLHVLTPRVLKTGASITQVMSGQKGQVWLGMEMDTEIETLTHVSFFIRGTNGLLPQKVYAGNGPVELAFASAEQMERIAIIEPFDSQQAHHSFFEALSCWKQVLSSQNDDGRLIYITDALVDRDVFKGKAYPKSFQKSLESSDLDTFGNNTLWILFDFGNQYEVPDTIEILPNVVPVVNVGFNSVSLTQSSPIAQLTKSDGAYFFHLIETSSTSQKQGFSQIEDDVVIRDFNASCYNKDLLYRDVRNLYNRFIDDYYAFVDYHGLKDGELIKSLRNIINRIGKSVVSGGDSRNQFDEGVYAMRNVNQAQLSSVVKVSYLTTWGRIGNAPKSGELMENKKDAAVEKEVSVITSGMGGEDKPDADQRYELLRYYTLTSDRLYTKMDIDAFLRMQLLKEFGKDEMNRIKYSIQVQGAGGGPRLKRGLYIDILFKDSKNYQKAESMALDYNLRQKITEKSCISMPIIVTLIDMG